VPVADIAPSRCSDLMQRTSRDEIALSGRFVRSSACDEGLVGPSRRQG
jgi:hypothetical protein